MTVVVSGDTAGWIVPCGCASNQSGGLPRRAAFIDRRRETETVFVADVGGAGSGTTVYDRLKLEAILRGESEMGVCVHNIGKAEAESGPEIIRLLSEKLQTPWISANTTDTTGKPLVSASKTMTAGKRRIIFIGVLSQDYQNENIRVASPRQAVLRILKEQAGSFDYAVVLAYMPEDELRKLAQDLPEVDAVVGGPTGQPVPPVYAQGHTLLTSATRQGKFIVVLTFPEKDSRDVRLEGEIVELDERFADEPGQIDNVQRFYAELKHRDLTPEETPFVESGFAVAPLDVVAGTQACQSCHEEEYRIWKESRHAAAWESLVPRGAQYDPDCQRCHVTGYGWSGGFESAGRSTERRNVGCESCHGASSRHCVKTEIQTSQATRASQGCLVCHDKENSPMFDYDQYWTKIRHGDDDLK